MNTNAYITREGDLYNISWKPHNDDEEIRLGAACRYDPDDKYNEHMRTKESVKERITSKIVHSFWLYRYCLEKEGEPKKAKKLYDKVRFNASDNREIIIASTSPDTIAPYREKGGKNLNVIDNS